MTTTPLDHASRSADRRRGITARGRVLAAAGVVLATVVATSFALFSDSGQVTATFESGTLDLKFDDDRDGVVTPHELVFPGGTNLTPGSSVSRELRVFNSGSVPADLALAVPVTANTTSATARLEDSLMLRITDVTDGGSTPLYFGLLTGPGSAAPLFTGLDIGAGGSESTATVLQLEVSLAGSADIGVAGQSVGVTFDFTATQQ